MHSMIGGSGTIFEHNGDFDGLVKMTDPSGRQVVVDMDDLKEFVGEWKRRTLAQELEIATGEEVLIEW